MPSRPGGPVPGLFLSFLAPSFRPHPARLGTTTQPAQKRQATSSRHKDSSTPRQAGAAPKRDGEGREAQQRRMSGLAAVDAASHSHGAAARVASTSAFRLDSRSNRPFSPARSADLDLPGVPALYSAFSLDEERSRELADLPAALRSIRSLHLDSQDDSPSSIIERARSSAPEGDWQEVPPTPPPPIALHPQPYSDSTFFTPFLLQAIFLGASALGLFARRKVRTGEGYERERGHQEHVSARERAEDRIDEVQALNLLISAYAVPEACGVVDDSALRQWRDLMLVPLSDLVSKAIRAEVPLDRLGVASILHFLAVAPPDSSNVESQRRADLLKQAVDGFHDAGRLESSSANPLLEWPILASLLEHADCPSTPPILGMLSQRTLDLSSPPVHLVARLGEAALSAKDLEVLARLARLESLAPSTRLDLVVKSLEVAATRQIWRNDRETILPLATLFADLVVACRGLDKASAELLRRGLCLLRSAYSIDRPLEPFITRALLSALSTSADMLLSEQRSLVTDVLRHLVRSRNPKLARRVFEAIPAEQLRLSHFYPLLASSHVATSQAAWDLLWSHPNLPLTPHAVSSRFTSHAQPTTPRSVHKTARQDLHNILVRGDVEVTIDVWNKYLQVVCRFSGDVAVRRTLAKMDRAGVERNDATRTILVQREMVRGDVQVRKRRGTDEDALRDFDGTDAKDRVAIKRRAGGRAQLRMVREAVRQAQAAKDPRDGTPPTVDITPNLVLKSLTRWSSECDTARLVQLTRLVVGVDLVEPEPTNNSRRAVQPTARDILGPKLDWTEQEYRKLRTPAFRTLIRAFERRGRTDLAKDLRRRFANERWEFEQDLRRRREVASD
ncbi:hypothetical protein JCM10212_001311 [Sporobolomyces blumeae]